MRLRIELYSEITKTNLKTWSLLDFIVCGVMSDFNKHCSGGGDGSQARKILKDQINKTHQIDSNQH